nr:hypothetical protein [Tanacetum cinerariifolium]
VNVEYPWKPDRCSHCQVFGHPTNFCKDKAMTREENERRGQKQVSHENKNNKGFMEVKHRKNIYGNNGGDYNDRNNKEGFRDTRNKKKVGGSNMGNYGNKGNSHH